MAANDDGQFGGFPPGRSRSVRLHAQFFSDVLPLIDDLAEMKIVLFCYWALLQKDGHFRYLIRRDFANNTALMRGLHVIDADANRLLDDALARAVDHKILLCGDVEVDNNTEQLYFLNTELGRTAIEQLKIGNWEPALERPIEILPERPTIYALYEKNIGPLTPHIADRLQDAEDDYSAQWVADAIALAVENNARNWRYIEAILERWKQEGRANAKTGRSTPTNHEFAGQKWSDFIDD